jgi:hypothetical protein
MSNIELIFSDEEASGADHISLSRPTSAERGSAADVDSGSTSSPAIRTGSALSGSMFSGKILGK